MKVLFINSLEPNQADLYFLGLRKILGENNVVEYPFKPLYHCFLQEGRLVGYDLEGNEVVKENTESGTLSYAYGGYPVPRIFGLLGSRQYECEEGFPEISNYDLIIVAFLRGSTPAIITKFYIIPEKFHQSFLLMEKMIAL